MQYAKLLLEGVPAGHAFASKAVLVQKFLEETKMRRIKIKSL